MVGGGGLTETIHNGAPSPPEAALCPSRVRCRLNVSCSGGSEPTRNVYREPMPFRHPLIVMFIQGLCPSVSY